MGRSAACAAAMFAGTLWVFYYSPLFSWATTDHIGHEIMIVHFLLAGYLFVQSLIGVDPMPFVMAVSLGRGGPTGRQLLTYSQSTNPNSPTAHALFAAVDDWLLACADLRRVVEAA